MLVVSQSSFRTQVAGRLSSFTPALAASLLQGGFVSDDDRVCLQSIKFAHAKSAGSRSQDNLAALRSEASRRASLECIMPEDDSYLQVGVLVVFVLCAVAGAQGHLHAGGGCWRV